MRIRIFALVSVLFFIVTGVNAQVLNQADQHANNTGILENFAQFNPTGIPMLEFGSAGASMGTNGTTCQTCHQPSDAFGLATSDINTQYAQGTAQGNLSQNALFDPIDRAVCPDQPTNYSLLLNFGLIRIILPIPPNADFTFTVKDPNNCQGIPTIFPTKPANPTVVAQCLALFAATYGPNVKCISVWRRPLPSTNLSVQSTVMWDGREPSPMGPDGLGVKGVGGPNAIFNAYAQQASDATIIHAQATQAPNSQQIADMVNFELAEVTTQEQDNTIGLLTAHGAQGTAEQLALIENAFVPGLNDSHPVTGGPQTFQPQKTMTLFSAWQNIIGTDPISQLQESVYRGEVLFNTFPIPTGITTGGVAGTHPCSFCHNNPNIGSSSDNNPPHKIRLGTGNPGDSVLGCQKYLPTFNMTQNGTGAIFPTCDMLEAMITGAFANAAMGKVPQLHGLNSRLPLFSNGLAPNIGAVLAFYQERFNFKFSTNPVQETQDVTDLTNFLSML